jgi:tyrosinase
MMDAIYSQAMKTVYDRSTICQKLDTIADIPIAFLDTSLIIPLKALKIGHLYSTINMSSLNGIRIRRSIESIYNDYLIGQNSGSPALQKPLNDLIRARKGIIELGHTDPNSFFNIGGLHGEPFRGAGYGSAAWWGGWCNHGNILFPTWHRAYCLGIEDALRTIEGCEDVTLPYWDETGPEIAKNGVPEIFLQPKFLLDGEYINNPLYSYKFAQNIVDNVSGDKSLYSKHKGYNTVRYPYSGLVGTEEARMATLGAKQEVLFR